MEQLVPQQAQPSSEADDKHQHRDCADKLNRLVSQTIVFQHGHFDTAAQSVENDHRFRRKHSAETSHDHWGLLCQQWRIKAIRRSAVEWAGRWDMTEEETARAIKLLYEENANRMGRNPDSPDYWDVWVNSPGGWWTSPEEASVDWERLQRHIESEPAGEGIRIRSQPVAEVIEAFRWFTGRHPTQKEFDANLLAWKEGRLAVEDFKMRTERFKNSILIDYHYQHQLSSLGGESDPRGAAFAREHRARPFSPRDGEGADQSSAAQASEQMFVSFTRWATD